MFVIYETRQGVNDQVVVYIRLRAEDGSLELFNDTCVVFQFRLKETKISFKMTKDINTFRLLYETVHVVRQRK